MPAAAFLSGSAVKTSLEENVPSKVKLTPSSKTADVPEAERPSLDVTVHLESFELYRAV